jgi:hypothetical protein
VQAQAQGQAPAPQEPRTDAPAAGAPAATGTTGATAAASPGAAAPAPAGGTPAVMPVAVTTAAQPTPLAALQVAPATRPTAPTAPTAVAAKALALRPSSVVEPQFPREGWGLGSRVVTLQARLSLDAAGSVTRVDFVHGASTAGRVFERAARNALMQWRFPPGAADRSYVQELTFKEE